MVSDLRGVNRVLKRVGHPLDGSSHILKRLDPDDKYYIVCDLSMGYHQLEVDPELRDIFAIVLPRGKFRALAQAQIYSISHRATAEGLHRHLQNRHSMHVDARCAVFKY